MVQRRVRCPYYIYTILRVLDRDLLIRLFSQPIQFSSQLLQYSIILNEEVDRRRQRGPRHIFTRRYT